MSENMPAGTDGPTVPAVISRYQHAHDQRDIETALSAFSTDATVVDEDQQYDGTERIRAWLSTASTEYTYTRTFVNAERTSASSWIVVNHLEGNFPGGQVDLRFQYTLAGDKISALTIAP